MSSRDYLNFPFGGIGIVENSAEMPEGGRFAENSTASCQWDIEAFQEALNQSALIEVTGNQGDSVFINDAFCGISDYSREELPGRNYRIGNAGYPSRNRDRDVDLYGATRPDITHRNDAEEQLNQMNQVLENRVLERTSELENLNRSLQAFSCMVSHDLKAPARKNSAFTKILLEEYQEQLDEAGQDYLRRIDMNSQRMSQLIDDFIRLSGIHYAQLKRGQVNLTDLAGRIIETFREQEPHRSVAIRIQPDLVIDGDESLLQILLENLIGNAWKFTAHREKTVIEIGMEQKEFNRAIFYVRDNGVGFDMAQANRLFQPFQRFHANTEFPGTGIGLATVHQIVERHQGLVWLQSQVNQGTTVYFLLPEGMENARF